MYSIFQMLWFLFCFLCIVHSTNSTLYAVCTACYLPLCVCVYMYVCMYVCMYVGVYPCMHACVDTYTHVECSVCIYRYIHTYMILPYILCSRCCVLPVLYYMVYLCVITKESPCLCSSCLFGIDRLLDIRGVGFQLHVKQGSGLYARESVKARTTSFNSH